MKNIKGIRVAMDQIRNLQDALHAHILEHLKSETLAPRSYGGRN